MAIVLPSLSIPIVSFLFHLVSSSCISLLPILIPRNGEISLTLNNIILIGPASILRRPSNSAKQLGLVKGGQGAGVAPVNPAVADNRRPSKPPNSAAGKAREMLGGLPRHLENTSKKTRGKDLAWCFVCFGFMNEFPSSCTPTILHHYISASPRLPLLPPFNKI